MRTPQKCTIHSIRSLLSNLHFFHLFILSGFFSMMILLVLYKNYCKPSKTLSEEQLNAAVTAAAEEEDRALAAALEATSFYTALGKKRKSSGNNSPTICSPRFSSVGGGYSHLTPPVRLPFLQQRGKSLPGESNRLMELPCIIQNEFNPKIWREIRSIICIIFFIYFRICLAIQFQYERVRAKESARFGILGRRRFRHRMSTAGLFRLRKLSQRPCR